MTTIFIPNSINRSRCALLVIALACIALAPVARAVSPPPDGGYANQNTAEGSSALFSLTTGVGNTGLGFQALYADTTGGFNTAIGVRALRFNTTASDNTATGWQALYKNTTGTDNTAVGHSALEFNTTGSSNTALGNDALSNRTTGNFNTALGANAGSDPDIVSNNIYIGDPGFPGDTNVISIGGIAASGTNFENTFIGGIYGASVNSGTALPVYVDTDGHLGTTVVIASGQKMKIRAPNGGQPQAKLKEFQKQEKRIAELEATVARLAATVKEQAAQIQNVSAQVEMSRPAARVVVNNQ